MSDQPDSRGPNWDSLPVAQTLSFLDLATEVLEGLDELGVTTRADLISLMERLERQIAEES